MQGPGPGMSQWGPEGPQEAHGGPMACKESGYFLSQVPDTELSAESIQNSKLLK